MIPFSALMFPHSVSVSTSPDEIDARGGVTLTDTASSTFAAYVEAQSGVKREERNDAPAGVKRYNVYSPVDIGAYTDTLITWNTRTFTALARTEDLSGAGVSWRTECVEVL